MYIRIYLLFMISFSNCLGMEYPEEPACNQQDICEIKSNIRLFNDLWLEKESDHIDHVKSFVQELTLEELKASYSRLCKIKKEYYRDNILMAFNGYEYNSITPEKKKKLGIEYYHDYFIALMVKYDITVYRELLKEKLASLNDKEIEKTVEKICKKLSW